MSQLSTNQPWAYWPMKYSQIGEYTDVMPNLSAESPGNPGLGVTLHWSLPDGFLKGIENDEGDLVFPFVPNRWLVVRHASVPQAWIVESDKLTNSGDTATNQYDNNNSFVWIGKQTPLSEYQAPTKIMPAFLTAEGPGDPAFAGFTPNILNVFSFYDDLKELENTAEKITYSVYGWLTSPADDPLQSWLSANDGQPTVTDWEAAMSLRDWSISYDYETGQINEQDLTVAEQAAATWFTEHKITPADGLPGQLPAATLCHGLVFEVNWLGYNGDYQSGIPSYAKNASKAELPQIAMGNTSIDAFSALIQTEMEWNGQNADGVEQFLQAFQYDQLNANPQPSGDFNLTKDVHNAWFKAGYHGRYWIITNTESPDPPTIPDNIVKSLRMLNGLETQNVANTYELQRGTRELYGMWWKLGWANINPFQQPPDYKEISNLIKNDLDADNADSLLSQMVDLQQQIAANDEQIQSIISKINTDLQPPLVLQPQSDSNLWQANDPTAVLYGVHRTYKYGEDGRFTPDDLLFTRFTGQTLTGIEVTYKEKSVVINASNITIDLPADLLGNDNIPLDIQLLCQDLIVENFFLNTGNADAIATKALELLDQPADPDLATTIVKQQTLVWNKEANNIDDQTIASLSGLQKVPDPARVPSLIGVSHWDAPWSPLYLAWEVKWYPSSEDPSKVLTDWEYNPEILDYAYTGSSPAGGTPLVLNWFSVLTPQTTFVLEQKLQTYFTNNPDDYKQLADYLDNIAQWDFLSQAMSGFNQILIGLNHKQINPVKNNDTLKQLVGDNDKLAPNPSDTYPFMPIRAGHFQIQQMRVVDDFGQIFDPLEATGRVPGNYDPVLGDGLPTKGDATLVQLPPRLMQDARLLFRLVDASTENSNNEIIYDPTLNPVCGWILPNHLDKGLTVYDAEGNLLGEILEVGGSQDRRLRWFPTPGQTAFVGTPLNEQITNPNLYNFVSSLINLDNSAAAFNDLIQVIDETMWTVDPLGGRDDSNLSVLVGRPLAIVRARLNYNLVGGPIYQQSWESTTKQVTGGYDQLTFPVYLGSLLDSEDGLMGYYLGNDYQQFNSIHEAEGTGTSYVANKPVPLSLDQDPLWVSMIVDPRGHVNATTGILPIEQMSLPSRYTNGALEALQVTFRTGPLITEPTNIKMPLPAEIHGKWSWIQHTGVTVWEETANIDKANQQASLSDKPPVLKEGWLKLADALGGTGGQ